MIQQGAEDSVDLAKLCSHVEDVVSVHDTEGHFVHVTQSAQALTGHELDALHGMDARELAHPEDRDRVESALLDVLRNDHPRVEWRCRRADGSYLWLESRASLVSSDAGQHIVVISRDIEDRVRASSILRAADARMAALGHTLAGVAHELNNPLTSIKGFAQVLLRSAELSSEDREALEIVNREAARAATIVRDLLTFARRQEGSGRDPVQLNDVVSYLASAHRYAMQARGITCVLQLDPLLPSVMGDVAQLEQVVLNLLMNARQALEAQLDSRLAIREQAPTITFVTSTDDAVVRLEVRDNGPGIAPEDLPHIWEPFWTTKSTHEGTGLGLAVVKEMIAAHGGEVRVNSDIGRGTSVMITLPSTVDPVRVETPSAPLDVLFIQPESSVRDFLVRYLGSRGHAVIVAPDEAAGLTLVASHQFDVVVCATAGDGAADLPTRVSEIARGHARLVAFCARTLDPAERSTLERLGFSAFIEAPVEIEVLRNAVEGRGLSS